MKCALLTRFYSDDYNVFFAPALYDRFLKTAKELGLSRALDDTKPGLLFLHHDGQSRLWVTGIASGRQDCIGTAIRFNLLLEDEESVLRDWAGFFLAHLNVPEKRNLQALGSLWDTLVIDNKSFSHGTDSERVIAILQNFRKASALPPLLPENPGDFMVASPLVLRPDNLAEILTDASLRGVVLLNGKLEPVIQRKKKTFRVILTAGTIFVIVLSGVFYALHESSSRSGTPTASTDREAAPIPPEVRPPKAAQMSSDAQMTKAAPSSAKTQTEPPSAMMDRTTQKKESGSAMPREKKSRENPQAEHPGRTSAVPLKTVDRPAAPKASPMNPETRTPKAAQTGSDAQMPKATPSSAKTQTEPPSTIMKQNQPESQPNDRRNAI